MNDLREPRWDDEPLVYTRLMVQRINRLGRAFEALLEDIAHNPLTAAEAARFILDQEED